MDISRLTPRASRLITVVGSVLLLLLLASLGSRDEVARLYQGLAAVYPIASASAQESGKVFNVREFGARGDGISNDTPAIQKAIDAAPAGSTIYFPAGIYDINNFIVKNRSGLTFTGEGQKSTIRQTTGAGRFATFESSRNIVITDLAFDANGIMAFGGIIFSDATDVRLENNKFFDGAPKPWGKPDRSAFNFSRGSHTNRDIKIINNNIENVQVDFAHSQQVLVDRNVVKQSGKTAGIGIYSIGDGSIAEDFQITNNTVIDPLGAGFNVGIDSPTDGQCIFRRITLTGNQVIRTNTTGYGIRMGTGNNSKPSMGNIFEDITLKDNRLRIEKGAPAPLPLIFANSSSIAAIHFERLTVTGNTIENNGPPNQDFAIDLRFIQNSVVADNSVKGVANGIAVGGDLLANEIRGNVVAASEAAYALAYSLGKNRAMNNRILGNPKEGWILTKINPSDVIVK